VPEKKAKAKVKIAELEVKLARLGNKGKQGKEKVDTLLELGNHWRYKNLDKQVEYVQEALDLAEKLDYRAGIGNAHLAISSSFYYKGGYDSALEHGLIALRIFEELDNKSGIAIACNNIGNVFLGRSDNESALKYYSSAIKILEELGDKVKAANIYNNAGIAYKNIEKYKKAIESHRKALAYREEMDDKHGIGSSNYNIGDVYVVLKEYDKALNHFIVARDYFQLTGVNMGLAYVNLGIGGTYFNLNKLEKASSYLQTCLKMTREIGIKELEITCLTLFSDLYQKQKEFQKALDYFKQASELKSQLFNEESEAKINQLRLKYETEQKEKEAEIIKLKNEELEEMVAERTAKLEAQIEERKHAEGELKEKLALIEVQRAAILELSTPVIKIWEGVVVIPLIGVLDSKRAQHLTEELLTSITTTQSKMAIIDITGVPTVDSAVANHLLKTVESVKLLGAECVITGIKPDVAQTIVHLGIDIDKLDTRATLADGLKWAFGKIE